MKTFLVFFTSLILFTIPSFGQSDTTYTFLDKHELICNKDSASYISIFYKNNTTWYRENYDITTNYIKSETSFTDDDSDRLYVLERRIFADSGLLYRRDVYVRGSIRNGFYYYPNGAIHGSAIFNTVGEIIEQAGFDENGGRIKDYFFEKSPELSSTSNYWQAYVYQHLRPHNLFIHNAPNGAYKLRLNFYVDINGNVQDIKVENDPGFGAKEEAIRLLNNAGKWNPGIINGQKSAFYKSLIVSFKLERSVAAN